MGLHPAAAVHLAGTKCTTEMTNHSAGSVIASFRLKEHRSAQRVSKGHGFTYAVFLLQLSDVTACLQNRMFRSQFSKIYDPSEIAKDKKSSKRRSEPKKRK